MTKKQRAVMILVALMALFAVLYSSLYIAVEANHDCTGDGCQICIQINACDHVLKNLSLAAGAVTVAAALLYMRSLIVPNCADARFVCTLVSLKVKLSN